MRSLRFLIASAVVSTAAAAVWMTSSSPVMPAPAPVPATSEQIAAVSAPSQLLPAAPSASQQIPGSANVAITAAGQSPSVNPSTGKTASTAPASAKPVVIKPTRGPSEEQRVLHSKFLETRMASMLTGKDDDGDGKDDAEDEAPRGFTPAPTILQDPGDPPLVQRNPTELIMRSGGVFDGDLRNLPQMPVVPRNIPEREMVAFPVELPTGNTAPRPDVGVPVPERGAPAPATTVNFEGLNKNSWGAGWPPDTNMDVGPNHIIETVNTSVGIYDKTGVLITAFTFNALMSQGAFGNVCDTNNNGDPVVLYDTFEDRWVLSDFAMIFSGNDVVNPPGVFECFAVSKTGDPVAGGWNFYSINTTGGFGDYPKLGIWPDGLYVSFNVFSYLNSGGFFNVRLYALNKHQMYAGSPTVQVVSFDLPSSEFSLMPANARIQTGTPPLGAPNYFTSVWNFANAISVWKFHVDWEHLALSTLTGPFNSITTTFTLFTGTAGRVPSPANPLDTLYPRLMMQNQYSNIGGVESLWNSHTVGTAGAAAQAGARYYQTRVTGGTVEANSIQSATWSQSVGGPNNFMPSVAVNKNGDMALLYNVTSASVNPAIRYAGRLAGDPVNTLSLTEQSLVEGGGSQNFTNRWGDYATLTLDPNGCTFWGIGEYYQATGSNWNTRVGAFTFPSCTNELTGTLSGTVRNAANTPLPNATVKLGARTTTTDATGAYSFANLPDGTYESVMAVVQGYNTQKFTSIVVPGGGSVVQNFSLTTPLGTNCFTDTSQLDFQTDVAAVNCDLNTTPGSVLLTNPPVVDQQNATVTNSGFGFTNTSWAGQTFLAAASGPLTRADLRLFCFSCSGADPNITVSIRATAFDGVTSTWLPTGADLATATITGFNNGGVASFFTANFASPVTITAGTRYAVIFRAAGTRTGTYAFNCSCNSPDSSPYANGAYITSGNSGASWAANATVAGGRDMAFAIYVQAGYAPTGTFTSSLKDGNPVPGGTTTWGNITFDITTPGGTTALMRVAGSNNPGGPFNFVGPDGTAGTSFASGASLAQFNGFRYLRYQVAMTSTGTNTPSINDVTICFTSSPRPILDLNADGNGDVFTYASSTGVWKRQVTQSNGTFVETGASSNLFNWSPGWSVVAAKFNQDNNTDFFVFNTTNGNWFKVLNDGDGFTAQAGGQWWNGWQRFVMDLDGDGISDIFVYDSATGVWWKCVSTPTGFTYTQGQWNPSWEITPMTLNGDALGDMFVFNRSTGRWFWVYGQAGPSFTYPATSYWSTVWNLYPADFNADGLSDLLVHDPASGAWYVAMNNGLGTGFTYTGGYWVLGLNIYTGDLDADGDADLFLYNPSTGVWYEVLSNGLGAFTTVGSSQWITGWNIYLTDLNGDKRTDIFVYNPTNGIWYQARNLTNGTFTYSTGNWATNLTIIVRTPFM